MNAHSPIAIEKCLAMAAVLNLGNGRCVACVSLCMCVLIKVAVEGFHASRPGSELLGLDVLLAATNAAESLLQGRAHTLTNGVAASNTRGLRIVSLGLDDLGRLVMTNTLAVVSAGGHLGTRITNCLVVFQGFLNCVRWLTLAFEIIRMVVLEDVSKITRSMLSM
jgi:hypothetical protein